MRFIKSREYKVMLQHRWLEHRKIAVKSFWREATAIAEMTSIGVEKEIESPEKRMITFYDTSDHLFRNNGLVFRRRIEEAEFQFTLKARSEDRYISDGFDLEEADGLNNKLKFEEDIAPPFRSRFSHSNTVKFHGNTDCPFGKTPTALKDAASLFPVLGDLSSNGETVSKKTKLLPVNGMTANERVYKGPMLKLGGSESASIAVILWSNGWNGRPLVAEFSFRYRDKNEDYSAKTAQSARRFFEAIQTLDWCSPASVTKTQYVYRESSR